jgi:hypothetical protein
VPPQNGHLVPKDNDFQLFELGRPEKKRDKLQNALNKYVAN